MWTSPLDLTLIPTNESESFRNMSAGHTGLPMGDHPGAYGVRRENHIHEGIDLYCEEGTLVRAVEDGMVVAVMAFTGEAAGSPWWHDTMAVLVEGDSGVILYGEITSDAWQGDFIRQGEEVGRVKQVLKHDKGRPMSMLHLELHLTGTREAYEWTLDGEQPPSLRDPTELLLNCVAETV